MRQGKCDRTDRESRSQHPAVFRVFRVFRGFRRLKFHMTAHLIIVEKSGRWAAAFRRQAGNRDLPIVESRSSEQALRELTAFPASIAAVEVTKANATQAASLWWAQRQQFPAFRWLALLDEELADIEALLRESGAVHVALSPRDLGGAVRLIRRHLARAPRPEMTLEEAVFARLPWPAASRQ